MRIGRKGSLFQLVVSDENLTEAWHRVRTQASKSAGIDGVSMGQFQRHLFRELKRLQRDLETGRYEPQPAKLVHIPKKDGGTRPIGVLTVRDRVAQWAVLNVIAPVFERDFEETSFGYRPGRSPKMALEYMARLANQGFSWALHLDIEDCFGSIPLGKLYRIIRRRLKDRRLCGLIHRWLYLEAVRVGRREVVRHERPKGLLQGSPLSPLFANVYLDQLDKLARRKGLQMVRYADDMIVLCRSRAEAEGALRTMQKLLSSLELKFNRDKTVISHLEEGLSFLGGTLRYRTHGSDGPWIPVFPEDGHGIRA